MPSRKTKISDEENQKPLFFDSLRIMKLPVNNSLTPLKISSFKSNKKTGNCKIKFEIPESNKLVNVYLFVNTFKKDMYYQLQPGISSFDFNSNKSDDLFELFYVSGGNRSPSVFSFLKGWKNEKGT